MALGERLRYFRKKRGMTQKGLGLLLGFPEKSADIRVAQYENGSRCPKSDVIQEFSDVLDVSSRALALPNIDDLEGVMHTFFALEDLYGFRIGKIADQPFLYIDRFANKDASALYELLAFWGEKRLMFESGLICQEEYDSWRYQFGIRSET